MKIFGWPLGFIMLGCYMVTGNNYALAIVLFTVATKLALLPLSIKQQKEQAKMQLFQPKLENIQKKYGNNKERYNEEIQKLYTEEGYNPMAGCLPSLIQFPILFGIMDVVYKPVYHILRVSTSVINQMISIAEAAGNELGGAASYYSQINLMKVVKSTPEIFSEIEPEIVEKIANFDMNFLGLDLSVVPQFSLKYEGGFNWYLLIPILCGVFQLLQTVYMNMTSSTQKQAGAMNAMFYLFPLMSVYIGFVVPAGAGFYWAISALFMLIQSVFLNIFYNPKKLADQIEAQMEAEKEEKRQKRVEARERLKALQNEGKKGGKPLTEEENLNQKEANRRKLAEARKRDAEKYGEEYVEVTDEDLK